MRDDERLLILKRALERIASSVREKGDGYTRPLSRALQEIARRALDEAK